MKTNAPKKIYIVNDDLNIKREWYKTKQVGFDTTEYTCTDAFIEKACKWIKEHSYDYLEFGDAGFGADFHYPKMIEDFRKAMKGE